MLRLNVMPKKNSGGTQATRDGKPIWRLRWELTPPGAKERKYETRAFHGTRDEAEGEWIKHEATILRAGRTYEKPSTEKVRDYLAAWLDGKKKDLRPATVDSYERMLRVHIIPAVGGVTLADLTPRHIQAMMTAMQKEDPAPSPRTVSYARTVLRIALQDALNLGMIQSNPVDRTKAPKQRPVKRDALNQWQLGLLFEVADRTRMGPLIRFAAFSGLRRGEILGLRWDAVDLEQGRVLVARSLVAVHGKAVPQEDAKTEAGIRTIPLVSPAREALKMQRDRQAFDKQAAGEKWTDSGLVFTTADGKALSPNNVTRDFRRLRDHAGPYAVTQHLRDLREQAGLSVEKLARAAKVDVDDIAALERGEGGNVFADATQDLSDALGTTLPKNIPLHGTRHTAVSVLLGAGVDLAMVSKMIGHKRYALTVDQYGHLTPEAGEKIAAQVDDFLSSQEGKKAGIRGTTGYRAGTR